MMSCDLHDYIEIACMYKYKAVLYLTDGSQLECVCLDVIYNEDRRECIKILKSGQERVIELETIRKMKSVCKNPHFDSVEFI